MKKLLILLSLFITTGSFAQNINFEVRSSYQKPIKDEVLKSPNNLDDLIPHYPHSWIESYISTQITLTKNGKSETVEGKNANLSPKQIALLKSAGIGDQITIVVNYQSTNGIVQKLQNGKMNVNYTVVPDIEAQNSLDTKELRQYLRKEAIDKLQVKGDLKALVKFTVNEKGEVTQVHMSTPSGYAQIDKILMDAITHMPKWIPAQNTKGAKFKQEFVFDVNNSNNC